MEIFKVKLKKKSIIYSEHEPDFQAIKIEVSNGVSSILVPYIFGKSGYWLFESFFALQNIDSIWIMMRQNIGNESETYPVISLKN